MKDRFFKVISELRERSNEAVILVEGRRDVISLRRLGVNGEIMAISNISRARLVDELTNRDVIILTDWDEKGEYLERELTSILSTCASVDVSLRRKIFGIVGGFVVEVEGLADLYFKLQTHPRSL
ncbi:MAG: hypothetical protein DRP01_10460 [Archaeoglobales archaeon]|nr:MAG: hypothetical protein DRP01_10460 [Archaeoglobales archaeon]